MNRFLGVCIMLLIVFAGTAQNTRSTEAPKPPRPTYQATKKEKKGTFAFLKKKRSQRPSEDPVAEFRSRLEKVNKQRAKEEKKMEKPRYSDPSYFGHKRPPKKRPIGKQKFCKVCKIKH